YIRLDSGELPVRTRGPISRRHAAFVPETASTRGATNRLQSDSIRGSNMGNKPETFKATLIRRETLSGRGMADGLVSRMASPQPGHRGKGTEPGAGRREQHVHRVLGVADHRKGREHVPDGAPIRRHQATPAAHR